MHLFTVQEVGKGRENVITINQIMTFNTKFYTRSFKDNLQSVNRDIHSTVKWGKGGRNCYQSNNNSSYYSVHIKCPPCCSHQSYCTGLKRNVVLTQNYSCLMVGGYYMSRGWALHTCSNSLQWVWMYLMPTRLFSCILMSPNHGNLIRTLRY